MKKTIKGFILLIIIITLLMSTAVGESGKNTIDVIYNSVNLTVNGQKIEADNILYNGTTYVPFRAVAEALGKDVGWDEKTKTASINDNGTSAKTDLNIDSVGKYGSIFKMFGTEEELFRFKINKITTTNEISYNSDKKPAQVLIIDYTYKNTALPMELYFYSDNFKVVDSTGKAGYEYPVISASNYPQHAPVGVTCDAQISFGIDNLSDKITLYFYPLPKNRNEHEYIYEIPIEPTKEPTNEAVRESGKRTIDVIYNSVNLTVNGHKIEADNILYDGTTYVPFRAVAEALGKDVGWDEKTKTASITNKRMSTVTDLDSTDKYEYTVKDSNGNALYSFKINKIITTNEISYDSDKKPAQVLIIDYTYKNIANPKEVCLFDSNFQVVDSKGKAGYEYSVLRKLPKYIPVGESWNAQMSFGIDNVSDKITLYFYQRFIPREMTTSFEIPVK